MPLAAPANFAGVLQIDPETHLFHLFYSWDTVGGADHYQLQIDQTDNTFGDIITSHDSDPGADPEELSYLDTNTLESDRTYFARVRANDGVDDGDWSEVVELVVPVQRSITKTDGNQAGTILFTKIECFCGDFLPITEVIEGESGGIDEGFLRQIIVADGAPNSFPVGEGFCVANENPFSVKILDAWGNDILCGRGGNLAPGGSLRHCPTVGGMPFISFGDITLIIEGMTPRSACTILFACDGDVSA